MPLLIFSLAIALLSWVSSTYLLYEANLQDHEWKKIKEDAQSLSPSYDLASNSLLANQNMELAMEMTTISPEAHVQPPY